MAISTQKQLANLIAEHHRRRRSIDLVRNAVNRPRANHLDLITGKLRATVDRYLVRQETRLADLESRLDILLSGLKFEK